MGNEAAGENDTDSNNLIGRKLRRRRKVRGMSLKDVATKANVSVGLISQVERDISMPSVRTLSAICGALEMPVSWLFDGADNHPGQVLVRRHQRRTLDLGSKGMIKELMTPDSCSGIQMMRLVIQPGGSSGDQPYRHEFGAKCGTVISGVLALEINGVVHKIEAGDSFAFDAKELIRFWAVGDVEADLFWVVAPAVY